VAALRSHQQLVKNSKTELR